MPAPSTALVGLLKSTWSAFSEDHATRLAGSIAFGALFAVAPLLVVLIAIAGAVLGPSNHGHAHHIAEDAILGQIAKAAGPSAADSVRQLIAAAFAKPREGLIAQTVGWITFAFGASAFFGALQDALNAIWHIEATKGGWLRMGRDRLVSFALVAVLGLLLVLSLVANSVAVSVAAHFASAVPFSTDPRVLGLVSGVVSFALLTAAFALIYKVLPDVDVRWADVWTGGAITAALFVAGQFLIGLYLSVGAVASAYGAAGSILVLLIWIYYSAVIVLVGAELTKVRARDVRTSVPAMIGCAVERPAGIDPRGIAE